MKHGPIALIDKFMPVVIIAPQSDSTYDKIRSNIEVVSAREGSVIIVTEEGNHELDGLAEAVLYVPRTEEFLAPLLTVVPLQLLAVSCASVDVRGMSGCSHTSLSTPPTPLHPSTLSRTAVSHRSVSQARCRPAAESSEECYDRVSGDARQSYIFRSSQSSAAEIERTQKDHQA
jgi:hypothetical protein